MGYQRKEIQVLGGGFNLLPPADKTPITDYLLAQNWRVDREGRLVSRFGYPLKFQLSGPAWAHSAAIFGGVEGDWYIGANAMIGGNPGAVYYNFGATPIVTGLSGRRVGFAPMNGSMWIMDSAVQGRHNGTDGYQPWGLAGPVAACTAAAGGAHAGGPSGSYEFYCTFETADYSLESNPGDPSLPVSVTDQNVDFTFLPTSSDPQMAGGHVNIYATGGTLGSGGSGKAYLVATVPNGTATGTWNTSDLTVTNDGIFMPTLNDLPPAGAGLAGPHFSRLFTWVGNRLFYTEPGQPQYWPGSSDRAVGNWVDVGMDGENILWCTVHTNVLMIYKERSIWRLVGDPDTGTLDQVEDGTGLISAFAIVPAGQVDYFVAPNGLRAANADGSRDMSGEIRPLFQSNQVNSGPLTPPGGILPGADYATTSLDAYGVALGYAMGKLYVAYSEHVAAGASSVLLVYDEHDKRWMYHRDALGTIGFQGFLFDGVNMVGLTGTGGGAAGGDLTQIGLSVPGTIALATNAAPLVSLGTTAQSTVIAAMLKTPAIGGPVTVEVYGGATLLGTVTIAAGSRVATTAGLMVSVAADTPITLNITAVGSTFPGADLSVQVWFYAGAGGGGTANVSMGYSIDDFRGCYAQDEPTTAIECVYQSHYEDCQLPDNHKNWLEVVVDYEITTDVATVYAGYDNGSAGLTALGTITGTGARQQTSFPLGTDGVLAKNISVAIAVDADHPVVIHNVYLYYYVEARLAMAASTIPLDLGSPRVKQCKELMLDVESLNGTVGVKLYSDLPGNALSVRQTPTVGYGGRAPIKYPFPITEGYLWRVALTAGSGPFRLYSARLLMRVIGTYVEAYEAANGFVWDSQEMNFSTAITHIPRQYAIALAAVPIKRFREVSLEIDTFNENVTVTFLTDLPGNAQATRATFTVNTGTAGRRFVRLPLPADVEGRMCRIQISGSSKFVLYDGAVEFLAVGVYIEGYEAAAGAVWDSREQDFGSAKAKEFRELELDLEVTGGEISANFYADLPAPYEMAVLSMFTPSTTGRQKIRLPMTQSYAPYNYWMGRMARLILSGPNAFRLYGARVKLREFGTYLTGDEAVDAAPAAVWDSTPLDFETERLKEFKKLELEIQTDATATLTLWTDQGLGVMTQMFTGTIDTGGVRLPVKIPLPPGIRGRLLQAQLSGAGVRLFSGKVWLRPLNEPKAQWLWAPLPIEPTPPEWKWAAFPVNPTPPVSAGQDPAQWTWGRVLEIAETPNEWNWVDVPFEVVG